MTLADRVTELVAPTTEFERDLIDWVVAWDEYRVADRQFDSDDVVIDVGAHVGTFSAMCHALGSRSIRAFEPDPSTVPRLVELGRRLPGLEVDQRAVFRSDTPAHHDAEASTPRLVSSGGINDNTGASNVLFGGRTFDIGDQFLGDPGVAPAVRAVETVPLDEILESIARVTLLKLDCEGSEYPILLTSRLLHKVDEIVGEYHVINAGAMEHMTPSARLGTLRQYGPALLVVRLQAAGFEVTLRPAGPSIGLFRAIRRGATGG